jgi:hypothetical protein
MDKFYVIATLFVVSIYCFHVDDALTINDSYHVFRAYDIRYSHRFHQHNVSIIGLVRITSA